jgi:hypothetical protein
VQTFEILVSYKKEVIQRIQTLFDEAIIKAKQAEQSSSAPISDNNITSQIQKLADLKDSGILTEEEFQAKKTELLSRI